MTPALVVDTGCYLSHDAKGAKHVTVAVDHRNQNLKLMPFIEKQVKLTGTLIEKGGMKGIALKTVEAAK